MPLVAFANAQSNVACADGTQNGVCATNPTKYTWSSALTSTSGAVTVSKTYVETKRPVVKGDAMTAHPNGEPCVVAPVNHTPICSSYSPKVFIEGSQMARIGDKYNRSHNGFDHEISTGASKVYAEGGSTSESVDTTVTPNTLTTTTTDSDGNTVVVVTEL
jgi:uncharacterized Zn-binding protein involved in type VI secretion